jgi:hypothetical protein
VAAVVGRIIVARVELAALVVVVVGQAAWLELGQQVKVMRAVLGELALMGVLEAVEAEGLKLEEMEQVQVMKLAEAEGTAIHPQYLGHPQRMLAEGVAVVTMLAMRTLVQAEREEVAQAITALVPEQLTQPTTVVVVVVLPDRLQGTATKE